MIQMVSVVEMSPEDYPGEIPGSYGEACAALGGWPVLRAATGWCSTRMRPESVDAGYDGR